ncbi:hypothetical protein V3C99_000549, partial [Haemonchus contortus]
SRQQFPMRRLVVFVSIIALALACAQKANSGSSGKSNKCNDGNNGKNGNNKSDKTTTKDSDSKTTKGNSGASTTKGKREVGQAQVTLVTYLDFDAEMTSFYLEAVRSVVEQQEKSSGIFYNPELTSVKAENISGKFAVVYTILGVDCDELNHFISSVNGLSALTEQVTITCGGRSTVL